MKKLALLALILLLQARTAIADQILAGRLGMVGVEGSSSTVFINANIPQCQFGAAYFEGGTVKDRKAALMVAINAKLFDNTVRVDFTQPAGVDTRCYGSNVYMNSEAQATPAAIMPTINVIRTPAILVAGQPYANKWTTSNTTELTFECTAKETGFRGKGVLFPDDKVGVIGTASPDWVGYPSTCIYTASGPGGTKTYTETMTTVAPPAPTIAVTRTPSTMVVGQPYTLRWTTTNATALTYNCKASGSGYSDNGSLAPINSGEVPGTALAGWVGYPSSCVYTATGLGGTKTFAETLTTVAPPAPTIAVTRTPSTMVAGQAYTFRWTTTNATALTHNCTANGTGFKGSGALLPINIGAVTGTALAEWVGYPSTCVYTATATDGTTKTYTETLTTVAPPAPTIAVTRTPSTMVVGQPYTLRWTTTNATALTYDCKASGSGYSDNGSLAPISSGEVPGTALAGWVGYPSSCVYTATGLGGTKTFAETLTTVAPPAPTLAVTRTPSTMVVGQAYTLRWTTTNATALTYDCKASGSGYFGNGSLTPINSGEVSGSGLAGWVGYPSNCVYTATGPGGIRTYSETLNTVAPAPTISVSRSPSSLVVGQAYTFYWTSSNAVSVAYACSATPGGFSGSGSLTLGSDRVNGVAEAAWVGHPSSCTYTATAADGRTATASEYLTTNAK